MAKLLARRVRTAAAYCKIIHSVCFAHSTFIPHLLSDNHKAHPFVLLLIGACLASLQRYYPPDSSV